MACRRTPKDECRHFLLRGAHFVLHSTQSTQRTRGCELRPLPALIKIRGWGSCRDFAVPFTEASRMLGFGARIVSGYLYNPEQQSVGSSDAGSTHAWAEVFVPGAGWITFDPTNRSLGGFNLIPVAVARDIRQTIPVSGSFVGSTGAFAGMSVEVRVTP